MLSSCCCHFHTTDFFLPTIYSIITHGTAQCLLFLSLYRFLALNGIFFSSLPRSSLTRFVHLHHHHHHQQHHLEILCECVSLLRSNKHVIAIQFVMGLQRPILQNAACRILNYSSLMPMPLAMAAQHIELLWENYVWCWPFVSSWKTKMQ
jgi:hypothetical protein